MLASWLFSVFNFLKGTSELSFVTHVGSGLKGQGLLQLSDRFDLQRVDQIDCPIREKCVCPWTVYDYQSDHRKSRLTLWNELQFSHDFISSAVWLAE